MTVIYDLGMSSNVNQRRGPRLHHLAFTASSDELNEVKARPSRRVGFMASPELQYVLESLAAQGLSTSDALRLALVKLDSAIRPDDSKAKVRAYAASYGVTYAEDISEKLTSIKLETR